MTGKAQATTVPTLLGIAAIVIWSTTIAFSRSLTEQVGPLTSATLIYALGSLLGWGYWLLARRLPRFQAFGRRYLVICGLLFVLYMTCLYTALGRAQSRGQALGVGLLNYLWPMFTLLFSLLILRLKANGFFVPGVLVATLGVFLVTTRGQILPSSAADAVFGGSWIPYGLAFTAALSWGLYSTLNRKWGNEAQGSAVPLFMLATALVLGLTRLLVPEQTRWTGRAVLELAYLAVGPNLAYFFWERATQKGDIVLLASCSYLTPLASTLISSYYLAVPLTWPLWVGCGMIIGGALLCNLAVQRAQPDNPARSEEAPTPEPEL